jgi:class 3 adenylate cyclase/tetratricopeptide (TPR) repeat protein
MEYCVLGPLEVIDESGHKLSLGGAMQQSVLALLLLRVGKTVALDNLIEQLWDEPPATAARTVQVYISRLRHQLPKGAIESGSGGYRLVLDGGGFDLETFERQAEEGHRALAAGQCEEAGRLLHAGLALWRGPALAGLTSEALQRQAERLEELRLTALEDRLEADLGCAREAEIVPELKTLVAEHPFRERLRAQLMRALYRTGRSGEALAFYRETRRLLVGELGMEPGQELRGLEQAILRQDAQLEAPRRDRLAAPAPHVPVGREPEVEQPAPREVRKTVTILFCDIVDSTARGEMTDPEVVRSRLAQFFEQMKTIVERHGGTVEKFIGDAVMAVFGVPRAHEDDALRACRAAIKMQEALPSLGVEGRIGLMTGEVVTGTEERLATGDAVNVAARLERAAGAGEVLLGAPTLDLVREAVEVEALAPVALKGKAQPVVAYRLKGMLEPVHRGAKTTFVGRNQELAKIRATWEGALAERRCELVTIVGEAGVGKSRLVAEALASIDSRVFEGRCLPYGEGITYWPVTEVLKQLGAPPSDPVAAAAIRTLLGESQPAAASAEEIAWAFRKLLEEAAPLVCVFDDIQWGEETFLDLVEHVALLSSDAPILLLCIARPELIERRVVWPVTFRLEPLSDQDVDELIPERISAPLRQRIGRAAAGNPLFVEEMLAIADEGDEAVTVPPTLHALLAARLDSLEPSEREVLERAAVEGEIFHRGAVQALAPEERQVTPRLASLVRKQLVRPDTPQLPGEDGFRFRHLLIRDAAYETLPKAVRAELHERLADWLGLHTLELLEADEMVGYHLEQAYLYRLELRPLDEHTRGLGLRAGDRLSAAGVRALGRNDVGASLKLLRRALALLPDDDPAVALRLDLSQALFLSGAFPAAGELANETASRAFAAGDQAGELRARLVSARITAQMPSQGNGGRKPSTELLDLAERARPVFVRAGDEVGLTEAWVVTAWAEIIRCRWAAMLEAVENALEHARRAGDLRWERELPAWKGTALVFGPTAVDDALRWYEEEQPQHSMALNERAVLEAMRYRFPNARALLAAAQDTATERDEAIWRAGGWMAAWEVSTLAGDAASAETAARQTCEFLEQVGETAFRSLAAAQLASSLYTLGRLGSADCWTETAEELASSDDVTPNMLWRQVRAKLLARRGHYGHAERLAVEAIGLGNDTDMLNWQGHARADLSEVYVLAGRYEEAMPALEQALALYERKGNLVSAGNARSALAKLQQTRLVTERTTN